MEHETTLPDDNFYDDDDTDNFGEDLYNIGIMLEQGVYDDPQYDEVDLRLDLDQYDTLGIAHMISQKYTQEEIAEEVYGSRKSRQKVRTHLTQLKHYI